jgi:hypothetical protein
MTGMLDTSLLRGYLHSIPATTGSRDRGGVVSERADC